MTARAQPVRFGEDVGPWYRGGRGPMAGSSGYLAPLSLSLSLSLYSPRRLSSLGPAWSAVLVPAVSLPPALLVPPSHPAFLAVPFSPWS